MTYLIVRGVTGVNTQISTLALTLAAIGCRVIDSPEVFAGEEASKALSSSRRFMRGGLPETFIAFSLDQARVLLEIAQAEDLFPLIAKPHLGKQGQGIARLHGPRDAERYVATFFEADVKPLVKVLLVQQMIDLEAEFRVLVVGNRPLGVVRKIPCHSDGTGNASTGARFEQVEDESVVEFARRQAEQDGLAIAGVDIGRGRDGSIYLLENNRAPQWQNFESATSINVADEVLDYLCSDSP
ncbi:MAG: hypothetical protein IIA66_07380 [Planctomycetes bacterium]|nr:hypothetical protein [Planctomycetota bacterium]